MHCIGLRAKKEKKENRCCFKANSEAVTFYTHELMSLI